MKIFLLLLCFVSTTSFAYTCNTDCRREAKFKYPCPTFGNPGRKCDGFNAALYQTCNAKKKVSCDLWEKFYDLVEEQVKAELSLHYNSISFEEAQRREKEAQYISDCQAAGVLLIATAGTAIGGVYGTLGSGAVGIFVSRRLCEQSTVW